MKSLLLLLLLAVSTKGISLFDASKLISCSDLENRERFDCFPEAGANKEGCEARGCCWAAPKESCEPTTRGIPTCYFPRNFGGYEFVNVSDSETGQEAYLQRTFPSAYPNDIQLVRIHVEYQTENRVRVKISDALQERYESIYPKIAAKTVKAVDDPNYQVVFDVDEVGFQVQRRDGFVLFNTHKSLGAFIFADQFLQISSTFNGQIYGLGEHRTNLLLDTNWSIFTMFNRDQVPRENTNLYGSHPFYLVVDPEGRSHGVFLHNSNAMDVALQPLDAVTFRVIGGILDFYFFMGPTPADVISQYSELIGRPFIPPYWSLGFQLCKFGYGNTENTRAVWKRTRDNEIPFDVQWNDIDYMQNANDFTIDPDHYVDLPNFVQEVHEAGMHYVPILDPGVSASEPAGTYPPYDDGISKDIFIKNSDGSVFIGKVWNPTSTAFPDFTNPNTLEYWTTLTKDLHGRIPFDGLWIDMNEPSNFMDGGFDGCPENNLESPPFVPGVLGGKLRSGTICMSTKQYAGNHYDLHNLYGISEAEVTSKALRNVTGKRGFVISRSTFPGSGVYTGHWSGDDQSTWYDLTKSVAEILTFNLYAIPFVGADICGFIGNSNNNLCNRWMQLGAFYPFARNHNNNGQVDQDPAVWGPDVIESSKKVLKIRYSLLPYLYTLFYRARVYGETVARPLFFEFTSDDNTRELDKTFLWGSGLLIVPVLEDNANSVLTYLPAGRWYDWYTQETVNSQGAWITLNAPFDTIPLLIRGGVVLPTQAPAVTTTLSRQNGFTFLVASDSNGNASGTLFWDDGDSIDTVENNQFGLLNFELTNKHFTSKAKQWNTDDLPQLQAIKILGVSDSVNQVSLNGQSVTFELNENQVLTVENINLRLNEDVDLQWS